MPFSTQPKWFHVKSNVGKIQKFPHCGHCVIIDTWDRKKCLGSRALNLVKTNNPLKAEDQDKVLSFDQSTRWKWMNWPSILHGMRNEFECDFCLKATCDVRNSFYKNDPIRNVIDIWVYVMAFSDVFFEVHFPRKMWNVWNC